jgi:hypothetical protein
MRGGYGRYFLNPTNDYLQINGFSSTTPMATALDGGRTPIADVLSNPYPSGIVRPPGASLGALSYVGQGFSFFEPDIQTAGLEPVLTRFPIAGDEGLVSGAEVCGQLHHESRDQRQPIQSA